MNKFNLILIIVSVVLFTQVASAQSYLVTESAPVYPGETTYVYVPIQNTGFGSFLNDVSVRLLPKDNASANAVTILDDKYSLGDIQDWGDQRTARFKIHVSPDAAEGDYLFNVFIYYRGQQISSNTPAPMVTSELKDQILTIKGKPVIVLLNSTLGIVEPMSINKETLKFKNTGTGTVKNAVAEIDLSSTGGSSKSSFSILGAGTKFSLGNLKAGDEAEITFDLAVDITATPGVYNLPLKITGLDNYSSDNFVGVVVAGTTNFEISYLESLGSFTLNVLNTGISPANSVSVTLPRQKNFSITGSSSSVIGNLNPGDYTSAIFQIAKTPGAGNSLEIDIQYTDTSGLRHTITKFLNVELSRAGSQSGASESSTNYTTWLMVVVLILVLYWQRGKITASFRKSKG
ncbi:MAG: hypothetical protein O8C64_15385 [Candidatus Methanoperedens sp.]|nr:hypothetical protein [Candidatus Methanoperedens sp.]MCZ7405831.1 hypothetical protein [Candidatus Methanoperedens sp.]